jgi:hypothetical protein
MLNFFKSLISTKPVRRVEHPVFHIPFNKIYEAEGRCEGLTLTPTEVSELLDYIDYMTWLTNKPSK